MSRRRFLKTAGATAVAAGAGIEGILAAGRAPAYAQGIKLQLLRWVDFVPAADEVMTKLVAEASKTLGAEVTLERINANDLQPRITAAVQTGSGPDIIHMLHNWAHLYQKSLVDVGDVVATIAKDQKGFYDPVQTAGRVGNVVLAAREPVAFVDPALPNERSLRSGHGSLTPDEMYVPLLAAPGRRG